MGFPQRPRRRLEHRYVAVRVLREEGRLPALPLAQLHAHELDGRAEVPGDRAGLPGIQGLGVLELPGASFPPVASRVTAPPATDRAAPPPSAPPPRSYTDHHTF